MIIYHNLGMGDHIICNAIVNVLAWRNGDTGIRVLAKQHNAVSVAEMYRGIGNLSVVPVMGDEGAEKYIAKRSMEEVVRIGCTGPYWSPDKNYADGMTFDEVFYKQVDIPFEYRWYRWWVNKVQQLAGCGLPFVHDDDRYKITKNRPTEYYTPNFSPRIPITAYVQMLKEAPEIHCINSSFLLLADTVETTGKLYFHKYARNNTPFCMPRLKKDWEVIE